MMDKYEQLSVVGEGSYGLVMKCRHKETEQIVAVKKFLETEEDVAIRKMALREIRMLKKLRHENLITMIEVFRHRKRFYLVFEYIDGTVLDELEKHPSGLGDDQSRERIFQVLRAIQFCHSNQIIHRDIKPENVLVSSLGIVKICDFGFARLIGINGEPCTEYVATRWYRAPELLVGEHQYGFGVDIWAIGCLFAEMMSGDPIFPGESDIDQLFLIIKMLGKPSLRHQQAMNRSSQLRGLMGSAAMDSTGLYREYPNWPLLALDFLTVAVRMDPAVRASAEDLLTHNYFAHDKFPSRFLPELREKVTIEYEENPLLRRYRVEILMSTDKRDEAIKQAQTQRRGLHAEMHRWRFNLLEGSVKRKYSYETVAEASVKPSNTSQKLNFIRKEGQSNNHNNSQFKMLSQIKKEIQSNEIKKLERSLECLTKLSSKRPTSAQNESNVSREISATLYQSLQPQVQEDNQKINGQPITVTSNNNNKEAGGQTLHPSIHNIKFERFGKGNEFAKKSSPNLLQSIQSVRGINHTNIPILTPQPRVSQLFLKRLDRNVIGDTIQPHVAQTQGSLSQPSADLSQAHPAAVISAQSLGIMLAGASAYHHTNTHISRKRERESFVSSMGSTLFLPETYSIAKNNLSGGTVEGVLASHHGKTTNKNNFVDNNGNADIFTLPMLPGATNTPKKLPSFMSSSLTYQGITPEIRYKKAKRKYTMGLI